MLLGSSLGCVKLGKFPKLYFGNKSYWYAKPSEVLVLKVIKSVLLKSRHNMMGTTELLKTVKHVVDAHYKKKDVKRKVQQSTISRLLCAMAMIRTCKKVGSRRCLKTFEIRRKRLWKYYPEKKKF